MRRPFDILLLGGLSAFGPLSIDLYLPALPTLTHDLGAGEAEVQLTLTACLAGLALGQVLAGPVSDAMGRRRPLLAGLVAYAASSLLCAVAPNVGVLIVLRTVQGMAGAVSIVIARAVVRDLYEGVAAARFYSLLLLVNGLAPILAPVIGGQLLRVTSWHGLFVVLALVSALLLAGSALGLRETLPPKRRRRGGLGDTLHTFGRLLRDRLFIGCSLAGGLAAAAMFAYIAASPFVLQVMYGVSPQLFAVLFAVNALGIVVAGQLNGRLVGRISPHRLLSVGLATTATGGVALLVVVLLGSPGLAGILPSLFLTVASIGLTFPNSTALALSHHRREAGSASGLLGVLQFMFGAAVAPLAGIGGTHTALPMSIIMAVLGAGSLAVFALLVGLTPNDRDLAPE